MTKRILIYLITLSLFYLLSACSVGHLMIKEAKSPYEFDKTVTTIIDNAEAMNWKVTKVYDFQKIVINSGNEDPGPIKIIKLCRGDYASRILLDEDSRFMSAMIPCSVSVYTKTDSVYVASFNISLMSILMGGNISHVLDDVNVDNKAMLEFLNKQ